MLQTASSNTGILEAETSGASGKQSVVTEDIASFPLPALQLSPRPRKSTLYEIGNDTEMNTQATVSYPPSSIAHSGAGAPRSEAQIREFRRKSNIHFAALCWFMFSEGWNDGTPGPLLPVIQQSYHVGFAVVSLYFVLSCVGFISGAVMNVWLNDKLGFGKVLVLGAVCQAATYAIQSFAPPFPLMILANLFAGFGIALQNAQANGFVGSLKEHVSTKLGFLHASYGVGAFVAPLVATQFSHLRHWSFFFLISLGIALSNIAVLLAVFRLKTQDDVFAEAGEGPGEVGTATGSKYRQILGIKTVHTLAFFILCYVGIEVTIGGWIVTFIIRERGGGPSAGYISSGFFGGLTLGRVSLMWLNRKIGTQKVIFLYVFLAIGLEITVWVVPSVIENAVAVAVIGLLLGPIFPLVMTYTTKVLPKWLITGSAGWIAGSGQAGSAILPFVTGIIASQYGISSLQPLLVAMMGVLIILWALVPKSQRRLE